MTDYPALDPCPSGKNGKHASMLMPMGEHEDAGPMFSVWACGNCGMQRVIRVDVDDRPLDDLPAAEIRRRTGADDGGSRGPGWQW